MEKEQIVKALECCTEQEVCGTCPFEGKCGGMEYLLENALYLIREQDKRIEELALEKAGFEAGAKAVARFIQGDTVRKMAERLKEKSIDVDTDDATLWMSCVPVDDIDQIAKQLLEDTK